MGVRDRIIRTFLEGGRGAVWLGLDSSCWRQLASGVRDIRDLDASWPASMLSVNVFIAPFRRLASMNEMKSHALIHSDHVELNTDTI